MDDETDGIVRRDFPRSGDGYDRAAVDAHLEAVAARVGAGPGTAADHELVRAGRGLLGEIAAVRGELKRVSDALRDRSATIAGTLEELLDLDAAPGAPSSVQPPGRLTPPPPPAEITSDDAQLQPPPAPVGVAGGDGPLPPPPAVEVAHDAPLPPPPAPPPPAPVAPAPAEVARDEAPPPPPPVDIAADAAPGQAEAASVDAAALADARLVALDMALGGSSREEIAAALAAGFELPDPDGLTDEVLAAIG